MAVSENDLVVGPLVPAAGVTTISLDFDGTGWEADWLEVYKSGSETPLVLNTDYTVANAGTINAVVTLATPANGNDSYSVYLVTPLERSSDMQLRGEFKSEPFNIEMDRLWQRLQHHNTLLGRTLRVGRTADAPGPYTPEPETVLGLDAAGNTTLYPVNAAVTLNIDADDVIRRENVAAVLADTAMGYTTGASVQVSAGQYVLTTEEGFSYKVAASGETDHHLTTAGGVKLYVLPNERNEIALEALSVIVEPASGGTADNTAALANISAVLADFTGTLTCGSGFVKTNGTFLIPRHASLVCDGTTFDASGSVGTFDRAVILKRGATPVQIAGLSASVTGAGDGGNDSTLSFSSAHNLSAGDIVLLYNPNDFSYSGYREYYREGEFATVAEVTSPTEVLLDGPLYGSHDHTKTQVFLCADMATGRLENFTVIAPGPGVNGVIRGRETNFCHRVLLRRLASKNSDNASATVSQCYRCAGEELDEHQWSESPGFGTQYGLVIENSQDCTFQGRFIGFRHGITTGGAAAFSIPCRGIHVYNFEARNSPLQNIIASADWHGNTEFSSYRNGQCYNGGLNIAGDHNVLSGVKVFGGPSCIGIYGREVTGLTHIIENVSVMTDRVDDTRGVGLDIGGNSIAWTESGKRGGHLAIKNLRVKASAQEWEIIRIRNRGFTGADWSVSCDGLVVESPARLPGKAAMAIMTVTGDPVTRVSCTNWDITGGDNYPLFLQSADLGAAIRMSQISGSVEYTTPTDARFVESIITMPVRWPKAPIASATILGSAATSSADTIVVSVISVSTTQIRPRIIRADDPAANFVNAQTKVVHWSVSLAEF